MSIRVRTMRSAALFTALWMLLATPRQLAAQSISGSIAGNVKDNTGGAAAGRHGGSGESGTDRKGAHGRHRRAGQLQDHRPAAGHLHRDVHAAGLQHGQARRDRADERLHGARSTPS